MELKIDGYEWRSNKRFLFVRFNKRFILIVNVKERLQNPFGFDSVISRDWFDRETRNQLIEIYKKERKGFFTKYEEVKIELLQKGQFIERYGEI